MAKAPTKTDGAAGATAPVEATYWEISLSRAVTYEGHLYRPGERHVVDDATLAGLGDAVETKKAL